MFDLGRYNQFKPTWGTLGSGEPFPSATSAYWPGDYSPAGEGFSIGDEDSTFQFPDSPETPVASGKLKAIGPHAAGLSVGDRERQFQTMTQEEREAKKKEPAKLGLEMDPAVWDFIFITRNQIKILTDLIQQLIVQNWMTESEAEKWRELCADSINRGQKQLTGGGAVLCYGPLRRSRLTFEVNEEKSTQFYRKIRIYAAVYFQKPLDKDIPPEPGTLSEPDDEMLAFMAEFGGISVYEEEEPPDYSEVWTEGEDSDAERAKWMRANVEQDPREWFRQIKGEKKAAKREKKQYAAQQRAEVYEQKRLNRQQRDQARAAEERSQRAAQEESTPQLSEKEQQVHTWAKLSMIAQVWKESGRDKASEVVVPGPIQQFRSVVNQAITLAAEKAAEIEFAAEQRLIEEAQEAAAMKAMARARATKAALKKVRLTNEAKVREVFGGASPGES